ncbi:MAG: hypothetical protein JRF60_09400 [Deltaproteobacteria bacterium]|nr:hypothetical protein [Deltaproteobacteria bacterium]MBW2564122.1 hypothetical protein [Deltaproteobacteria bacterium]
MYGLEAINAANGWAMAYTGAIIVFIGLVVLSFVISQLNRILSFWENLISNSRQNHKAKQTDELEDEDTFVVPYHVPSDIKEAARYYSHLVEDLDQPFELTRLYEISQQKGFPHPHITISNFRQANILVPAGDGLFTWSKS